VETPPQPLGSQLTEPRVDVAVLDAVRDGVHDGLDGGGHGSAGSFNR
jgi:hypothetical protein